MVVEIVSPAGGDVPGGGTFRTYGTISEGAEPEYSAVVKRQETVLQEGVPTSESDFDWAFDFTGLPTGVPLRLVVEAVDGMETALDQRNIVCVD